MTLVGLDVGTSGVKGVAIDEEGRVLATASAEYRSRRRSPAGPSRTRRTGGARRRACLARLPEGPVGLSGQMHGLVVLDADDRVLRPAILWNDQRTGAECAEIEARIGLERLLELTGNRALPVHRAEAPLAAPARAGDCTRGSGTCCCRRTTSASG